MPPGRDSFRRNRVAPSTPILTRCTTTPISQLNKSIPSMRFHSAHSPSRPPPVPSLSPCFLNTLTGFLHRRLVEPLLLPPRVSHETTTFIPTYVGSIPCAFPLLTGLPRRSRSMLRSSASLSLGAFPRPRGRGQGFCLAKRHDHPPLGGKEGCASTSA
jgi:hypothetical protein